MYDVIILGIGSMGSSTLYQLAKRGVKVLGIEQFGIGHTEGSHSGETRIVRKAYFEHSDYVPLLDGAHKGWKGIEKESGETLFHPVGLSYFGEFDHPVMQGVKESAKLYNIGLKHRVLNKEYPVFNIPGNFEYLFEPDAGFVVAEKTIRTYAKQAEDFDAELKTGEEVLDWKLVEGTVEVTTTKGVYKAHKLILTAGAYVNQVLPQFVDQHKVTRQLLAWVKPKTPELFELEKFPCWVISDKEYPGIFYGFPTLPMNIYGGNGLLKIAHHVPGEPIHPQDLHQYNAEPEKEKLIRILKKYIPDALGEIQSISACMYTSTPDEHFILDHLPDYNKQVIVASGFSGHGFKFVPVIGEILADLTLEGKTNWPIDFLGIQRF